MKIAHLSEMKRGWFIGNFEPSLLKTDDCEVAVKYYRRGDCEEAHLHRIATEYTCIISGRVRMNGSEYGAGDIIVNFLRPRSGFGVLVEFVQQKP